MEEMWIEVNEICAVRLTGILELICMVSLQVLLNIGIKENCSFL